MIEKEALMAYFAVLATNQPPLTNLLISLAFGVGQIIIGAGMVVYTASKGRWHQLRFFGLAVLGAWIACSGITELIVSGAELLAQQSRALSVAQAAQMRAAADQAFLVASIILLLVLAAFPLLARLGARKPAHQTPSVPGEDAFPGE
ncbi:MAG TPA: hypothetical protein VH540_00715 [Ktedonobacterales bacterium]|jgi:hypothetical protein